MFTVGAVREGHRYRLPGAGLWTALSCFLLAAGCGDSAPALAPGQGVIFSYPFDGQRDVPVGSRIVVTFSDAVDESALSAACAGDGSRLDSGAFCVFGPDGPLPATASVADEDRRVVTLQPTLESGSEYQIFIHPDLLGGRATNLSADAPLVTFRTRQDRPLGGVFPEVAAVNGEDPGLYSGGNDGRAARFPIVDFSTFRVLFSEPIDADTVIVGDSFEFVDAATGTPIRGTLRVQGIHLTFDPDEDLPPQATYRMSLTAGVRDLGGEPLVAADFQFVPLDSNGANGRVPQVLNTQPASGEQGFPSLSSLSGTMINTIGVSSSLIGEVAVDFYDGTITAEMADPSTFGTVIPTVVRKGSSLRTTGMSVMLGGQIPTTLQTGDLSLGFVGDAVAYLVRNPFRPTDQVPDDAQAPVFVYLNMDVALYLEDDMGNAALNQTVLDVQAAGTAVTRDRALTLETTAAGELDVLGVSKATVRMALALQSTPGAYQPSDGEPPRLIAAYPGDGATSFPARDRVVLAFSEPIDTSRLLDEQTGQPTIRLLGPGGVPLPVRVEDSGSSLVISPMSGLQPGAEYTLNLGHNVTDLAGNPLALDPADASGGDGLVVFRVPVVSGTRAAPPVVFSVYPGAPCALTGATAESPGRCEDGLDDDALYGRFTIDADRAAEVFFSQPISRASLVLGSSCGTGSVRVELLGPGGECLEAVAGALLVRERGFFFVPNRPWLAGATYRLTLVGGSNNSCDASEICGTNGRPLNTDPLDGTTGGEGGGPNMALSFVAVPPSGETYLPAETVPFTDTNANGFVDSGEVLRDENRGAAIITGVSGLAISSAEFDQPDCIPGTPEREGCFYLSGNLAVSIGDVEENCTIGQDAQGSPIVVPRCVPVLAYPKIIYATSLRMNVALDFLPDINGQETGQLMMRTREAPGQPVEGYIIEEDGVPQLVMDLQVYLDAPDMEVLFDLADHDLHSKPMTASVKGPVDFSEDGRVSIDLSNTNDVDLTVTIDAPILGDISVAMRIPAGQLKLRLLGHPVKGAKR